MDRPRGKSNRCEACERAHAQVIGAKCAMHESSTSATIDRKAVERPGWPSPGWSGPMLRTLSGFNPRAKVPRFDDLTGKRIS